LSTISVGKHLVTRGGDESELETDGGDIMAAIPCDAPITPSCPYDGVHRCADCGKVYCEQHSQIQGINNPYLGTSNYYLCDWDIAKREAAYQQAKRSSQQTVKNGCFTSIAGLIVTTLGAAIAGVTPVLGVIGAIILWIGIIIMITPVLDKEDTFPRKQYTFS
jgi:hypothetical protein